MEVKIHPVLVQSLNKIQIVIAKPSFSLGITRCNVSL